MTDCPKCGATVDDGKSFCSDCGTPLSLSSHPTIASPKDSLPPVADPSSQRFHPGQIFGSRYRIVAPLGRGGMGEVYRAEDLKLGQTVAIKLLPPGHSGPETCQRLLREARSAASLQHANIVSVFDAGEESGHPFVVMELITGPLPCPTPGAANTHRIPISTVTRANCCLFPIVSSQFLSVIRCSQSGSW